MQSCRLCPTNKVSSDYTMRSWLSDVEDHLYRHRGSLPSTILHFDRRFDRQMNIEVMYQLFVSFLIQFQVPSSFRTVSLMQGYARRSDRKENGTTNFTSFNTVSDKIPVSGRKFSNKPSLHVLPPSRSIFVFRMACLFMLSVTPPINKLDDNTLLKRKK